MYGYDSAFIGGTLELPAFKASYGLNENDSTALSSNVVSTFQAGAFFGAIFGFFMAEAWGRKPTILASGVIFVIGTVLQLVGYISALYVGRILNGIGVGCVCIPILAVCMYAQVVLTQNRASSTMIPIYIAECSPALIRGRLVGMFEIMLQIALVFGFWVNYGVNRNIAGTSDAQWRIPVGVQLIPAGLLLCFMAWMIESPRWLASKNKTAKARENLAWVRHLPAEHSYVESEIAEIQAAVNDGVELGVIQVLRECAVPAVRNRILIGVMMMLLQNFTGFVLLPVGCV